MSQGGCTPEIRKRALDILNAVADFSDIRVAHHPLACLMQLARTGHIDKEKQAALYLDVADDGSVESETAKMDKDGAAFWLDVAAVGFESLTSYEAAETEAEQFARRYHVVPPAAEPKPLSASGEDWRELMEKLKRRSGEDGMRTIT